MRDGRILEPRPSLSEIRDRCAAQLAVLPEPVRRLRNAAAYPVRYSDRVLRLRRSVTAKVIAEEVVPTRRAREVPTERGGPRKESRMARKEKSLKPARSSKAGRPPEEIVSSPRVRRRQKTAHVAVRKGTTILEAAHGPRVREAAKRPKVKKR
jgi:hypothetical protein